MEASAAALVADHVFMGFYLKNKRIEKRKQKRIQKQYDQEMKDILENEFSFVEELASFKEKIKEEIEAAFEIKRILFNLIFKIYNINIIQILYK